MKLTILSLSYLCAVASGQAFLDFQVTEFAEFQCQDEGFRCGYVKDDYENFIISSGQDSIGSIGEAGNNVWSNTDGVDGTLQLEKCMTDYCFVRCNYGCSCKQADGSDCVAGIPPAGTPSVDDLTNKVCPEQKNTNLCPQMLSAVPPGQLNNFDCYNFCNSTFKSACDFGGSCGDYNCGVSSDTDGTTSGIIVGCTAEMLQGVTNSDGTPNSQNPGGTSDASRTATVSAVFGSLIALLVLCW